MKKIIVFVCNGNIHRSVIAEKCLAKFLQEKNLDNKFSVASYGLQGTMGTSKPLHKNLKEYPDEYEAARPTLRNFDIDLADHLFQKITPATVKKAAVIIAMDKKVYSGAKNSLIKQFPNAKNKMHIFTELTQNHKDIKDPSGNANPKVHQAIIGRIFFTIKKNTKTILSWTNKNS
ncbi:MAG: hypothetical protein ABSF55_00355 [Candidatus Staskawiczbacteria bacterium]|jgi:protein-tyrosine-phosphatase